MLCHIAAALDNGAIDMKNVNQRPQVNVTLLNLINIFLIYQNYKKNQARKTIVTKLNLFSDGSVPLFEKHSCISCYMYSRF